MSGIRRLVRGLLWMVCLLVTGAALGDTLELKGGDHLSGKIESMTTGKVVLVTTYAGKITLARSAVLRVITEHPVNVAMTNGDHMAGTISTSPEGVVTIDTSYGRLQVTNVTALAAAWLAGAPDPTLSPGYVWKYTIAFDLAGNSGNSKSVQLGGAADAIMSGPDTDLKFYAKGDYGKSDDNVSDNRMLGGVDFERRFAGYHSWYVRDEIQRDDVQGIRFRNTLAGGYGYYFFRQEDRDLRLRIGAGHLFTGYTDPLQQDESSVSLDSGLHYREQFGEHAVWLTDITFQPAVDDFANYFATHESKFSIPLTLPNLSQEFGLSNQYESQPGADKKKLDTTYFTRTRLAW